MLWLKLIDGILGLSIIQDSAKSEYDGREASTNFLTMGNLHFTVEITDYEVSLVFREYGAEPIKIIWGGKVILRSIYGQEQQIIKRIIKILRKSKLFFSFDEVDEKELRWRRERKVILNKGHVRDED